MSQDHVNIDSGAQGGDNAEQVTQLPSSGHYGSPHASLDGPISGSSGETAGATTGADNAGTSFRADTVSGTGQADTKSDQSDYSTNVTNDDLLSSADNNGRDSGAQGPGSVENAAVSLGDVNQGAGSGNGSLTGGDK